MKIVVGAGSQTETTTKNTHLQDPGQARSNEAVSTGRGPEGSLVGANRPGRASTGPQEITGSDAAS
jgi:hypothetical protein